MEQFYSIQGEGFYQGRAAYFVRLAGCDVGCFWCDVKESWDADIYPKITIENIIKNIENTVPNAAPNTPNLVIITGGEPLLHNLDELTQQLKTKGFQTNIETSGSHPISGNWDWICVSPKKFKLPLKEVLAKADELKVIIYNKKDFEWAEENAAAVSAKCKLYLQIEWSKSNTALMPMMIEYVKQNPQWELSLQIHKYINVP